LPSVHFTADLSGTSGRARVVAAHDDESQQPNTEIFTIDTGDAVLEAIRLVDAFLIVQGRRHVALDRPLIRIGRRIDNDIVLDSPSISRQHAQIRWRQRYFVVYNVSSHGYTSVNGMQIQEHILRPGDVIALSSVFLVYGEGRDDLQSILPVSINEEMDSTQLKPEE
jgi:pSer/pThr/pTyr-binding forkhead associated (FHA) protein